MNRGGVDLFSDQGNSLFWATAGHQGPTIEIIAEVA
jgi:hypothetical protein